MSLTARKRLLLREIADDAPRSIRGRILAWLAGTEDGQAVSLDAFVEVEA